jgi:hypothetical protein
MLSRRTSLVSSVLVGTALSGLLGANLNARAEREIYGLTMRHIAAPPTVEQEIKTQLVKIAEAAEAPKKPAAKPAAKKAAKTSDRMAHWAAVMDQLGTKHKATLLRMIDCESDGIETVDILDTNGKRSRGILQFQDTTWAWFSREAGVTGSPLNGADAIRVADWALGKGYGPHWSCY